METEILLKKEIKRVPKLRFKEFKEEWSVLKFKELLLESRLGGNYSNSENESDNPLIKMGNIGRGNIALNKIHYIDKDEIIDEKDKIQYGDLFFNTRNTLDLVGKVAIWLNDLPVAYYNSNLMFIKFFNNFFMNYRLNSFGGIKGLRRLATGTTSVAAIYTKDLLKLKLIVPSLHEQQKIAAFLSVVDKKIEQLTRKKELLESYKKGVMQQLFSQQLRFKGENGKDFPEWEWLNGNKLFESISDKNHNSDLPILAITQDQGAIPREMINYQMTVTEKSIASYKVVQKGDFVISLRTFQGGIEFSNYHGICSPAYIVLRPSSEAVDKTFYKYYLKTSYYIKQLQKNLEGIRDGKMISYKYFSEIKLPFPSHSEQQKIADFLSGIDIKIEAVSQQITKTQSFKKGLLQQMFV